jgi:hypothetical protein
MLKNPKLTANSWNSYFLTVVEAMNNAANNGDASMIELQVKVKPKSIIFWDMTPCTRHSSETSGTNLRTTRHHIPKDDTLHNHRCENLKSYKGKAVPVLDREGP